MVLFFIEQELRELVVREVQQFDLDMIELEVFADYF